MNILQEDLHRMLGIDFLASHYLRFKIEIKGDNQVILYIKMSSMEDLFL